MKMAKASPEDLDMAMDLANVLDDIERGFFPTKLQSDEDAESERVEWIDTADRQQYERLFFGLKSLLNKGSISRVIWGMAVVCDPANECIDPDADTIEHHPKRQQLEQQVTELIAERDAAMKDAERWRTVELLMFLGNVELNQDEDGGYKILLFPAENIVDQGWEGNSPEQVVDAVKCYGQPEKQAETETTVPAIVFYPAGSLGEEVPVETCTYPRCTCPFDAPADPNWCARGLPHKPKPNGEEAGQ